MATLNYHFLQRSEKFDLNGILGIGYAERDYYIISNTSNFSKRRDQINIPIAIRIGAGMMYYFNDKIDVNLSNRYGDGGLLNGGISIKS